MPSRPGHQQAIARSSADAHAPAALVAPVGASLRGWARHVLQPSGQTPGRHHGLLLDRLEALSRGEIDRLMVLMPPGSAKSTYADVNSDLWGAYIAVPSVAGTYYVWAAGTDGSAPTVYPTSFTVS